ncbi:MAG: response regulator [Candidatus Manganitrophus sp.]|nr:response regulator [Candidatus Manganitrophus sp.]
MSEKVRVVIADDERPARLYLTKLLQTFQEVELLGEAENGPAAVELIKRTKPDLALLDLQMPGLDGLAVARSFQKEPRPLVVFVTAHDKFAVSAFEVEAFDFLLKPIDRGRLRDLFRRAMKRLELIDLLEEDPSPERAGARETAPIGDIWKGSRSNRRRIFFFCRSPKSLPSSPMESSST